MSRPVDTFDVEPEGNPDPFLYGPYWFRGENDDVMVEANALQMGWLFGANHFNDTCPS